MADNVTLDAGSGGADVASDDIAGVQYQRVKLIHGADGVNDGDVASANPLPVKATGAAAHDAAASGNPVLLGAYAKAAAPSDVSADADVVRLWALLNGAQVINLSAAGALIGGDATNGLDVDVTRSALPSGASTAAKQPALGTAGTASADVISVQGISSMTPIQVGDNSGSLTVDAPVGTPVFVRLSDGSSAISTLPVSLASVPSHAVTNAGTFAVQESGGVLTALQIMDDWDNGASDGCSVSGDVAHDAADAGEPVKIGAKAETSPKGITPVADGDRTDLLADSDGQLIVKSLTSGADFVSEAVSNTDGNSTAFSNFGAVASTKNAITCYSIFRTDSGTTMAYVDFRDGTAGSVLWRVPLPPGGGANLSLGGLPIFKTAANTALAFDVSSALTTVYISVSGFQTKV